MSQVPTKYKTKIAYPRWFFTSYSSGSVQDGSCGAFVELFDHVKVEFSFDDLHTQGRGCWVLTDLYILKFT